MLTRFCLTAAMLVATTAWSQVPISDPAADPSSSGQMLTPPPVNGAGYSNVAGTETQSNYLKAGLTVITSYSDNVLGYAANPVKDVDYSIYPTIAIDKRTSRFNLTANYAPGFTFYQKTTRLNQIDQNVNLTLQYRWTPHVTLILRDELRETSSVLSANPLSEAGISPQPPTNAVVSWTGNQLSNDGSAALNYQFSRNGMLGVTGTTEVFHYLNPRGTIGLYDSNWTGGSTFYNHRLSKRNYIGVSYAYLKTIAYPVNAQSEIQTHTAFFYYTIYLTPRLTVSLSGGPQHYDISQFPLPVHASWSPTASASIEWHGPHASVLSSYAYTVSGAGGLVGVFDFQNASSTGRWRFAPNWSGGLTASYTNNKNITPDTFLSTQGGHSIFGTVSLQHDFSERIQMEAGYTRLHWSYGFIPSVSPAPNTDRFFISLTYRISRPLGG
jgi:hypothetical protein